MVEIRRDLPNLHHLLPRLERGWIRRLERHRVEARLPQRSRRGCDLDVPNLPVAVGRCWVRHVRLSLLRGVVGADGDLSRVCLADRTIGLSTRAMGRWRTLTSL